MIDLSTEELVATSGFCSISKGYSGAELYYWDLDNLEEGSAEYQAFQTLQEEGSLNLYNSGVYITPILNGPFALNLNFYEGDADALEKAFRKLGKEEYENRNSDRGEPAKDPV